MHLGYCFGHPLCVMYVHGALIELEGVATDWTNEFVLGEQDAPWVQKIAPGTIF